MKYNTNDRLMIHVDNELPRIGSGYRIVDIAQMGWKWVKLKSIHDDPRLISTQKIKRSVWDKIKVIKQLGGDNV
jgi:hypothetical protein|tara:strand:+ start:806 stop:1027 length:222 start_codon:yes stop_codon:yes gene_type:complete